MSRCLGFYWGRDYFTRDGLWMAAVAAFPRKAEPGEQRFRLHIELSLSLKGIAWKVHTWPAWMDEPSAFIEFNRTMRPGR